MNYKPVIGLEVHVELKTKSKMFCSCKADYFGEKPNTNTCPVCLGLPGALPVPNKKAIEGCVMIGLALNCKINNFSKFDRKNYFYPDLPKGYQISQYDQPFCTNGYVYLGGETNRHLPSGTKKRIRIRRVHMEEDTAKLIHQGQDSLIDFNRSGVPLVEIVTEPDFESAKEVVEYLKKLQQIVRYLNVSDADMEKGNMRLEPNISLMINDKGLRIKKTLPKYKVEVKNINSFRFAEKAIEYEIKRQTEILSEGKTPVQETRGWDEDKQKTFSQRLKEGSADYRYFPEPDLPPLRFGKNEIEEIRLGLPELPAQRRTRFKKYGLTDAQIEVFTIAKHLGDYYERVASELDIAAKDEHAAKGLRDDFPTGESHLPAKLHTLSANYIITEFPPLFQMQGLEIDEIEGIKIDPEAFAELMVMIFHEKLSSTGAKTVLKKMAETGLHPDQIVKEYNLGQVSETGELEMAVDKVIEKNIKAVEDYKKGKVETLKYLVGQVMAATRGKANPQVVAKILENKLKNV